MKLEIPAFQAMLKCNEHLNHGPISIDLGPDVVPVVRCRDCRYYNSEGPGVGRCGQGGPGREDDDFCSRGERRRCP